MWAASPGYLFLSNHANTRHLFLSIPAKSRQHREAACCQCTRVLERLLSPPPSLSCCSDAQWRHSATEPLFMSSTAQKVCVNTSKGEHQVVTSNNLVVTQLYPPLKHNRVQDAAEVLPHNTAQQYAREGLQTASHRDTPLIKNLANSTYTRYLCGTGATGGAWAPWPPWHNTSLCLHSMEQRDPLHWLKPKTKVPPTESPAFVPSQEGF